MIDAGSCLIALLLGTEREPRARPGRRQAPPRSRARSPRRGAGAPPAMQREAIMRTIRACMLALVPLSAWLA